MKQFITLILLLTTMLQLQSQTAMKDMSINNIRGTVLNGGDLFSGSFDPHATFEVPKGRGKSTIYAAGIWIGGMDSLNNLHLSASTYRQLNTEFVPGPISAVKYNTPNSTYDHIFYLTQQDINYHKLHFRDPNYQPIPDIGSWPGNGNAALGEASRLAPFADLNANNIYEPNKGEYPIIPGEACAYTIFNDSIRPEALGIEVHQFVYGYHDTTSVLNNTLFVTYKIFNRTKQRLHDICFGQFIDYDLGNYMDDGLCSDSLRNMMFVYNRDDDDEGISGYGLHPPAMGCKFLNQSMLHALGYDNDFANTGNPTTPEQCYQYLNGKYKNNNIAPRPDCNSTSPNPRIDQRFLGSTKPFNLDSGASYCISMAYIFARTLSGNAQASVDLLNQSADYVQKYFNNHWIDDACDAYSLAQGIQEPKPKTSNTILYPNPANKLLNVKLPSDITYEQAFQVLNILGETIISGVMSNPETAVNIETWAPGLYFFKTGEEILKFIKF